MILQILNVLTVDHKPSNPEEEARIAGAGAQVLRNRVNSSLAVSRAFGDSPYKDNRALPKDKQKVIAVPDVYHFYLQLDQFLYISCDGIFESYSNEKTMEYIQNQLKETTDLAAILSELVTGVLKAGGRDNMSAMIIQLRDGTDYNNESEYILGAWYSSGNDSYKAGFRLDCENHGLKWEDVAKTLKIPIEEDSILNNSIKSMPLIVNDKTTLALKTSARPGISKSSRLLVVSPTTLATAEKEKKTRTTD